MSETTSVSGPSGAGSGDLLEGANMQVAELPLALLAGETPRAYSRRLYRYTEEDKTYSGRTAALLASRDVPFLRSALESYIARFRFESYPLDMALRQFLAWERLPTEAQQVDRILAAFAAVYAGMHPGIMDEHQTYLLAFALILLHTSTFNRSVRSPMSKADFLGVASPTELPRAVLEYMYDNVTLLEFVHMHDETRHKRRSAVREQDAVYKLLTTGDVVQLQTAVDWEACFQVPAASAAQLMDECDVQALHRTVHRAPVIALRARKSSEATHLVRLVRMGAVRRRDERTRRWSTWGVCVTGSALLWFRKAEAVLALQAQVAGARQYHRDLASSLHPDDVMPLGDLLCVQDKDTLRLCSARKRTSVETSDAAVWMAEINYIASLASCGLVWDDASTMHDDVRWEFQLLHQPVAGPWITGQVSYWAASAAPAVWQETLAAVERLWNEAECRRADLFAESQRGVGYARHLRLLTPMQRMTREKLEQASHDLLHTLTATQWELARIACRVHALAAVHQAFHSEI